MAGRCRVEQLTKREKALLRKAAGSIPNMHGVSVAFAGLWRRNLLRLRTTREDYTLSQKGLRWLAALEREEG